MFEFLGGNTRKEVLYLKLAMKCYSKEKHHFNLIIKESSYSLVNNWRKDMKIWGIRVKYKKNK